MAHGSHGRRLSGRPWQRIRLRILRRDDYLCVLCRQESPPRITPAVEIDHILPLERGGTDDDDNLRSLCREHHLHVSGARVKGCDATGLPLDPAHWWRKR